MQWIKNNQQVLKNSALVLLVIIIAIILVLQVSKKNDEDKAPTLVSKMNVISKDDFEYSFDSVKWIFDTTTSSDQTKINFTFTNFSRRSDKTPAVFAIPFFAKFVSGTCSDVTELPAGVGSPFVDDEECSDGPLVAVAQCGDVDPVWVTIHQCGERLVVSEKNSEKWEKVRTLNITKIVD